MSTIPWVEKYRPSSLEYIVLSNENRTIINSIINLNYFPNVLFYGPPGTGKTTTVINLINQYHKMNGWSSKGLLMHLNASDDRGIEIIRSQISMFVKSKSLLDDGIKFVVFDEVDYMTKNAQQALRFILNEYSNRVRFCLICNYISKIDDALQSEFLRLKFNNLPTDIILKYLTNIATKEELNIDLKKMIHIQKMYGSDIRSMINYLQTNMDIIEQCEVLNETIWDKIFVQLTEGYPIDKIYKNLREQSIVCNIDMKCMIKQFLKYIIRMCNECITSELLTHIEYAIHGNIENEEIYVKYILLKLIQSISN